LDHAAFERGRSNADNVIDSKSLERAARENRFPLFRNRALARFPLKPKRFSDKKSRQIKMLEQILIAKVCQLLRNSL